MSGVTSTGFTKETVAEVLALIEQDQRDEISPELNQEATSLLGQLNGIMADLFGQQWDLAQAVYRAMYPDSATGDALDQIAAITGTYRIAAAPSEVTLDQLNVGAGVTIPLGSTVRIGTNGALWDTLAAVTNSEVYAQTMSVAAESQDTGVITGNANTIDEIVSPIVGWSAKAAETSGNAETYALTNGWTLLVEIDEGDEQTVTFETGDFVAIGAALAAEVAAVITADLTGGSAEDANGYVRGYSDTEGTGSAWKVTGGTAATALGFSGDLIKGFNSADATAGNAVETDAALRLRRVVELAALGAGTLEAIRAALLAVASVTECYIFENDSDIVDGDGVPAHAFEPMLRGGAGAAIAAADFATKPVGIESHGDTTVVVTDSQGFTHNIGYSEPTPVPIHIVLTASIDSDLYPSDGDDQIKAAIVALGDTLVTGEDVIALQFKAVPLGISGVEDVTIFLIDTNPVPAGTVNIPIAVRELATFDTGDIDVTTI